MKRLLLLLLAALLLLPACTAEPRMEDEFLFYYRAEENAEGVLCAERAELDVSGVSLAQLMEKYLRGPRAKNLLPAVPADWQLLSAELEADTAVLAFDAPVPDHPAIETSLARAAIARTLLQLETVQKVTISLSGSGETVTLTAKDILYTDTSQQTQQEQQKLEGKEQWPQLQEQLLQEHLPVGTERQLAAFHQLEQQQY